MNRKIYIVAQTFNTDGRYIIGATTDRETARILAERTVDDWLNKGYKAPTVNTDPVEVDAGTPGGFPVPQIIAVYSTTHNGNRVVVEVYEINDTTATD